MRTTNSLKKLSVRFFLVTSLLTAATGAGAEPSAAEGPAYDKQSAEAKLQVLQEQIEATEYKQLPQWTGREPLALFGLALNPFRGVVRDFFNVTLDRNSDVLPEGRKKGIHTYGSTAAVEFIADGNAPFTGLYQGVNYGVIRLSLAAKPTDTTSVPGLAVKFLVDGQPSFNFVAMYSLDGQPSYNFFANPFSTQISASSSGVLKILGAAFATATQDPTKVDSAYLARTNQDGSQVAAPVAPVKLTLVPNADVAFDNGPHEVRDDFSTIAPGTTLYKVYGFAEGSDRPAYIGRIVTTSRFVSSQFGDEKLFFRHQRFNNK